MLYLKADTITEVTIGPAVAVGDGFTPVTNLVGSTADEFEIIKHGATTTTTIAGTLAAITGADGYYALDLSATDTNTEGRLVLLINDDSLILPLRHEFMVVNANVFDSFFAAAATDFLQVDATQIAGTTQDATDLADFAAAGYDPGTNKVQGVVLVDTTTTNTDTAAKIGTPSNFGSGTSTLAANLEDMADNGTASFDRSTDSLQAVRDRGDAAWTTGAGGSNPFVLQNTTITGLASQTTFNLTAGSADDGAYENMLAVVEDSATATQKAIGVIATYTGSTKTIVLREDPGIFTMANGDTIDVVVVSPDILDILADVGNISAVGAAIHVTAIASPGGFVLTTGSEVNTEDATVALDGTKHELSDDAGTLDGLYKFTIGGDAAPVSVTFTGNFNSNNDTFDIFGNTGTDGTPVWVQIGSIAGSNSSANTVHTLTMFNNMIVTDVAGEVQVRVQATGLTSSSFDVDQVFVSKADTSRSVGYANGRIFINTNASNTNTESFVDGVADNPVSTIAAAKTLSTNVGLGDFHTINGSSITLAETSDNESYFGDNYSLALGGQSCADIHIEGASVTGTGTAATGEMHFEGSSFLTTASIQSGHFDFTRFAGTVTFSLAGDYQLHNCYSGVAGAAGPTFAFAAVAITAEWRNWSGSINLTGLTSDDTITVGGRLGTVDLGSPASAVAVEIRGTYKEITNQGSAVVNTDGAIKGADVAAILDDTDDIGVAGAGLTDLGGMSTGMKAEVQVEADASLASYDGPTNAEMEARTLVAAAYFDPAADAVANVTLVATTTTNTDMLTAAAILAAGDVDGFSVEEAMKIGLAADAGKVSGAATTTMVIRAADDSKTRITATVDSDGNRSAVTLDETG